MEGVILRTGNWAEDFLYPCRKSFRNFLRDNEHFSNRIRGPEGKQASSCFPLRMV